MLYRFILSNFKSFAEETQFDMFPNPKEASFCGHIYSNGVVPVLKHSAIYGANGAGKSNLIDAMSFLRDFTTAIHVEKRRSWYLNNRFRLPIISESHPISFAIEFENNEKVYIYRVQLDADGVRTENLFVSGHAESTNEAVFSRKYKEVVYERVEIEETVKKVIDRQIEESPYNSVLAILGTWHFSENEDVINAYSWFSSKLEIITMERDMKSLLKQYNSDSELMNYVCKVFKEIGLGVQNFHIREENFNTWLEKGNKEESPLMEILKNARGVQVARVRAKVPEFTITEENGEKLVREFVFQQLGRNGYVGDMDVASQSTGTLRLLTIIPALYDAIYNGKTLFIDEIENSIHPILMKRLIRLIGVSGSNGQLVFSTHETALLNQSELLRPDEVWFVEKIEGCTKMYTLNDFKVSKDVVIEEGYLDGRFRAIPFIGTL